VTRPPRLDAGALDEIWRQQDSHPSAPADAKLGAEQLIATKQTNREKDGLAYPLLSDPAGEVSRRYGSWMAPYSLRHTFLIDPEGTLRQRWTGVHPAQHSQELLAALNTLQAAKAS
jgi:alkyl hydroperoxide reductase subunit AhpC